MQISHIILSSTLLLSSTGSFTSEIIERGINADIEEIFTSKDKDFSQQWHYDQVLKMELSEDGCDEYLSFLNHYTYKMPRLGLPKYH